MKKIILVALLGIIPILSFSQKQKIGHINSTELISTMPQKDSLQKKLENYAKSLKSTLETMQKEYENKVAEFQSKQEMMSDILKETKVNEIKDLEKRIINFQKSAETDLQKKEKKLFSPLLKKAKDAIKEVAQTHGYSMIIDSSPGILLYSIESDNILPLVRQKLNIKK